MSIYGRGIGGIESAMPVGFDVVTDASGNIIVVGGFKDGIWVDSLSLSGNGGGDVVVAKIKPDFSPLWAIVAGDKAVQRAAHVAVAPNGSILVTGTFTGVLDFGGGVKLMHSSPTGDLDAFVAAISDSGKPMWAMSYGDPSLDDEGASVGVAPNGDVVLASTLRGKVDLGGGPLQAADADVLFAKLDPKSGALIASAAFAGAGDQTVTDLAVDAQGSTYVFGQNRGTVDYGLGPLKAPNSSMAAFLVKLDVQGKALKNAQYAGSGDVTAAGIGVDAVGGVTLGGSTAGAVDFGGGAIGAKSGADATPFIAKLDGLLVHRWSKAFPVIGKADAVDLAVRPSNGVIGFVGNVTGSIDFGGGPRSSTPNDLGQWVAGFEP
jgi:hypothetical protein